MASGGAEKPQFVSPPALVTALDKYMEQGGKFPGLQNMSTQSAKLSMEGKESLFPGYTGSLGQAWQIAQSRSSGLVDPETAQRVSLMAAQSGFATGAGPGSEQAGLQGAKNYGLSAIGMQDSGIQLSGQLREEANRMMPLQAINQAFSPSAFRDEQVAKANLANQQIMSDMQYGGNPAGGIFGGLLGGGAGALAGGAMSGWNPAAMMMGGGMGAQMGGGIGGAYSGAQGQGMGGMFGGLGQAMQSFGGSMGSMGGSSGSSGGIFSGMSGGGGGYASQYQNDFSAASRPFSIGGTP